MSDRIEARILRYLEGRATREEREALERELSGSPRLRKDLEHARRGLSAVREVAGTLPAPTPNVADDALSEIRGETEIGAAWASRWLRRAAAIALLLLLPAAGWVARGMFDGRADGGAGMALPPGGSEPVTGLSPPAGGRAYLVLFLGSWPDEAELAPEDRMAREASYMEWFADLDARGLLAGGGELGAGPGLLLTSGTMGVNAAEPSVEPEERIVGFVILRAEDGEQARELAAANPHLRYGGALLLKPIAP